MKFKFIGIFLTGMLLLTACRAATETPTTSESPTETESIPTPIPEAGECLACHTDKQQLIDTAAPVEEAESESSGVG
ncbi:MAG: hypothetical protein H6634_11990 [Anaerolineales bacterium]|nr:hypothetical protein [Anaerolineales bacterium]MCB9111956.1 hypothetical protein [Anaerolineales bacterium]